MAVLPGVTAGSMMSDAVGETSGMFLVVTRMKSKEVLLCDIGNGLADFENVRTGRTLTPPKASCCANATHYVLVAIP